MKIALDIATFVGGLAAIVFFYDRFAPILVKRRRESRNSLSLFSEEFAPKISSSRPAIRQPSLVRVSPRWVELSLIGYSVFLTMVIAILGARTDFAAIGVLCMFLGGIPCFFEGPVRRRGHENLADVLLFSGVFAMFGGFLIGMVGSLAKEYFATSNITASVWATVVGLLLAGSYSYWSVRA